jgi:hypothetical protein
LRPIISVSQNVLPIMFSHKMCSQLYIFSECVATHVFFPRMCC